MRQSIIAIIVAAASSVSFGAVLGGPVFDTGSGHRYFLLSQNTWAASESEAVSLGGHLATINTAAEQSLVFSAFGGFGGQQRLLWIGLNDAAVEGQYRWASGETSAYTNWANGEPNASSTAEDYVAMYYPNFNQPGTWNDWNDRTSDPIGLPFNGVVEIVPEPTAIVFAGVGACMLTRRRRVR